MGLDVMMEPERTVLRRRSTGRFAKYVRFGSVFVDCLANDTWQYQIPTVRTRYERKSAEIVHRNDTQNDSDEVFVEDVEKVLTDLT